MRVVHLLECVEKSRPAKASHGAEPYRAAQEPHYLVGHGPHLVECGQRVAHPIQQIALPLITGVVVGGWIILGAAMAAAALAVSALAAPRTMSRRRTRGYPCSM